MKEAEVLEVWSRLRTAGVAVWIDGGWCVDALLGRQTRNHGDLDIAVGRRVRCISPERMFQFKTAYPPAAKDRLDVQALSERFGFDLPTGYSAGI